MRRRLVIGSAVMLAGVSGLVWALGPGLGARPLDSHERVVVDAIKGGDTNANPTDAARFVSEHLDVLLSKGVADAVDENLAALFDTAFRGNDAGSELLGRVVAAVAGEGAIHSEALRLVLADVAAARMAWLDERINAPAARPASDLPDDLAEDFLDLHDFLRETTRDPAAADRLRQALERYGTAQASAAPDSGEPREVRLAQLGRVLAFFEEAQRNAERGQAIEDDDADALEEAEVANRKRRDEGVSMRSVWLATDLYNAEGEVGEDVRLKAIGQPFVDANGDLKIELTEDEARAFRTWARTLIVDGMPAAHDNDSIGAGSDDIRHPDLGLVIEDRY